MLAVLQSNVFRFFVLTYLLSWIFWGIGIFTGDGTIAGMWLWLVLGSFGPSIGGLIMVYLEKGMSGVKSILKQLVKFKFPFMCWLAVLFALPIVWTLTFYSTGYVASDSEKTTLAYITLLVSSLNAVMGIFMGAGPLGEELGWRGYALPRLLNKFTVTQTNLILGLVWTFWHLPLILMFAEFRNGIDVTTYLVLYPLMVISATALLTVFWQWTSGSIFVAVFMHSLLNTLLDYSGNSIWLQENSPTITFTICTLAIAITALILNWSSRKARANYTVAKP